MCSDLVHTWSIKDLSYDHVVGTFFSRTKRVVLGGQDSAIFPARISNQSTEKEGGVGIFGFA